MLQAVDTLPTGDGGGNEQAAFLAALAPGGGTDLIALRTAAEAAYADYAKAVVSGDDEPDNPALDAAFRAHEATVERMAAIPARDAMGFAAKAAVVARGVFDGFAACEAELMESLAADAAAVLAALLMEDLVRIADGASTA